MNTLNHINSVLLANGRGDFALIHKNQLVDQWRETPYKKGALCTKEIFVLANKKRVALYDETDVKFYDDFKINGELEQLVCTHQHGLKAYLLDSSGKVITISLQEQQGLGVYLFISAILILAIVAAIVKVYYFPSKQPLPPITTTDDAARQDQQYAYQQMNLINQPRQYK